VNPLLFEFRLGRRFRFLVVLRHVHGLVLLVEVGFALEALRLGAIVNLAPVAFLFQLGGHFVAAKTAKVFRHAVLLAPPAFVRGFRIQVLLAAILFGVLLILGFVLGLGLLIATFLVVFAVFAAASARHNDGGHEQKQDAPTPLRELHVDSLGQCPVGPN